MKKILIVAFHFPPLHGGSGLHRTLSFVKHLPKLGWKPLVLAPSTNVYERVSKELLSVIPPEAEVRRAWAWDSGRHLRFFGRYPKSLSLPDRWVGWYAPAVALGMMMIRKHRPDVIMSTYPIATAHMIGGTLARYCRLPWVADFRDPMVDETFPGERRKRKMFSSIERRTVERASLCLFTAPNARETYSRRYPAHEGKFHLLPNGYEEEEFAGLSHAALQRNADTITLTHSGALYPHDRDPSAFFEAIRMLQERQEDSVRRLKVVLQATKHDDLYRSKIDALGIGQVVELAEPVPYRQALSEMVCSDGLLLLQGPTCNHQIPAKLYEYLRAGRPILALIDARGDTARTLRSSPVSHLIANIRDPVEIAECLTRLVNNIRAGEYCVPDPALVQQYSREVRAKELVDRLVSMEQATRQVESARASAPSLDRMGGSRGGD